MMKKIFANILLLFVLSSNAQVTDGKLLSQWKDESLTGSETYNNTYNEVWGLSVNGSEYAVVGSTAGIHFINVTDPFNPTEDFFVQGSSYGPHIIHRDFHDYKGYLYVVADEDIGTLKSTMQIIDISNLPNAVEVVYDNDDRIRKAHNIFIDSSSARLYAFAAKGGDDPYSPMRIYDISEPLEPVQLGEYRFGLDGFSANHYHDGFVTNNIAYLNAGYDGLVIADLSDPENPRLLTHLRGSDYPGSGYNHSGWLHEEGQYYYMGDETWGSDMKVIDVSDPGNVVIEGQFDAGNSSPFSIPHNQIAHCGFLYVSYYYDGLQVYDISDPKDPKRVMEYKTSNITPRENYEGAWGVYPFLPSGNILVTDMQNGLFVVQGPDSECAMSSSINEKENAITKFVIYPNPNQGQFSIRAKTNFDQVNIFNMQGQLVASKQGFSDDEISFSLNDAGLYIAELWKDGSKSVEKIIIQP